jgi:hypothetical protein
VSTELERKRKEADLVCQAAKLKVPGKLSKSMPLHPDRMAGSIVDSCWSVTIGLRFDPRPIYVGSAVDKVALGQISLRRLRFSHVSAFLLLLPERQRDEVNGPSNKSDALSKTRVVSRKGSTFFVF